MKQKKRVESKRELDWIATGEGLPPDWEVVASYPDREAALRKATELAEPPFAAAAIPHGGRWVVVRGPMWALGARALGD